MKMPTIVVCLFTLGLLLAACGADQPTDLLAAEAEEPVELARTMGEMHRYASKIGYALEGRNRELAAFYFEELGEALEDLQAVEEHEGYPIAKSSRVIMNPQLARLESALEDPGWEAAGEAYRGVIAGCNRCHTATEHAFVVILPATGTPPYAQSFGAGDP